MQRSCTPMLVSLPQLYFCGISNSILRLCSRVLNKSHHRHFSATARFEFTRISGVYNVPIGSNGYFSLSVVHPKLAPVATGNVIIRLPSGPLLQESPKDEINSPQKTEDGAHSISRSADDTTAARTLADTTSSTVATINYRLGELPYSEDQVPLHLRLAENEERPQKLNYRYPTPVHDTLTGFDWILRNLQPTRLGVIGTHIGGSLALMLALTEPRSVHAVAALEPICDWTSLDEYCTSPCSTNLRRKRHGSPTDLVPLLQARERFFATAERYFDTFASPILFLRSAGKEVPKVFPKYLTGPEHPVPLLVSEESPDSSELWDAYIPEFSANSETELSDIHESDDSSDENPPPVRRRKALSRWPPYGLDYGASGPRGRYSREPIQRLDVTLPWVRIFTPQTLTQDTTASGGGIPEETESDQPNTFGARKQATRRGRNQPETVLAHQATEMVDVMRRACFFGRERGFAEERVTLSYSESGSDSPTASSRSEGLNSPAETGAGEVVDSAGEWLVEKFNSGEDSGSDKVG